MAKMGFPSHIIELIKNLYHDQEATVRTSNGNTEWFGIGRGVRQGCILSPNLFNIYSEDIMRNALEGFNGGVKFGGKKITNRYADDTTLVCSSRKELMDLLNRIKQASEEKDLLLNTKKTKIMVVDRDDNNTDFTIAGNKIEVVNRFEYLGSIITTKGESTTEIRRRMAMARSTVQNMSHIWKSRGLSLSLKVRLLQATNSFSIATYGSESWAMTKNDRKRVDAFEMWCYRIEAVAGVMER